MAGRPRKPDEVKIREGQPGHHPPTLIGGRLTPDDLVSMAPPETLEPWQHDAWWEIIRPLVAGGILDRADLPAVEAAARALSIVRIADRALSARGQARLSHRNSQGTVAHWAIPIRSSASAEFRQWCSVLGIAPANRAKAGIKATQPDGGMAGELGRTLPPPVRLRVVGDAD